MSIIPGHWIPAVETQIIPVATAAAWEACRVVYECKVWKWINMLPQITANLFFKGKGCNMTSLQIHLAVSIHCPPHDKMSLTDTEMIQHMIMCDKSQFMVTFFLKKYVNSFFGFIPWLSNTKGLVSFSIMHHIPGLPSWWLETPWENRVAH